MKKTAISAAMLLALSMFGGCASLDAFNQKHFSGQVEKAEAVHITLGYDGPVLSAAESVAVIVDSGISIQELDGVKRNAVLCFDSCQFRELKSEYRFGGVHVSYWFVSPGKHSVKLYYSDSFQSLGNRTIPLSFEAKAGSAVRISQKISKQGGYFSANQIDFSVRDEPQLSAVAASHLEWALRVTEAKAAKK